MTLTSCCNETKVLIPFEVLFCWQLNGNNKKGYSWISVYNYFAVSGEDYDFILDSLVENGKLDEIMKSAKD